MISAVIFDLDGTIIDNEGLWETAFQAVMEKHNITPLHPFGYAQGFGGASGWWHEPGIGLINNFKRYTNDSIEKLVQETVEEYRKISLSLSLRPGVAEVVQKAKELGLRTALCTGSTWSIVEKELEELGMQLAFDVTVTGEEVVMSKPDPEIYFLAAQKLEEEPENCLVIEDAVAGVRAAKEAGMKCIGVVSDYAPGKLLESAGGDYIVNDITSIPDLLSKIV